MEQQATERRPSPFEVERDVSALCRERDELLTGYITEAETARRLGISRQAMFKRSETIKREMGGIKAPDGWWYPETLPSSYQRRPGRRPIAKASKPETPKIASSETDTRVLSVRLPRADMRDAVRDKAHNEGTPMAQLVASLLQAYLDGEIEVERINRVNITMGRKVTRTTISKKD